MSVGGRAEMPGRFSYPDWVEKALSPRSIAPTPALDATLNFAKTRSVWRRAVWWLIPRAEAIL